MPAITSPSPETHLVRLPVTTSAKRSASTLSGPVAESSTISGVAPSAQAFATRARSTVRSSGLLGSSVKTPANSPWRMRLQAPRRTIHRSPRSDRPRHDRNAPAPSGNRHRETPVAAFSCRSRTPGSARSTDVTAAMPLANTKVFSGVDPGELRERSCDQMGFRSLAWFAIEEILSLPAAHHLTGKAPVGIRLGLGLGRHDQAPASHDNS